MYVLVSIEHFISSVSYFFHLVHHLILYICSLYVERMIKGTIFYDFCVILCVCISGDYYNYICEMCGSGPSVLISKMLPAIRNA